MSDCELMLLAVFVVISLLIWVYLWCGRDAFWSADISLPAAADLPEGSATWPAVHVVVPARNEASMLPATLPTLLGQRYPGEFHIFLVDDQSRDGTADVARRIASRTGSTAKLTVLQTAVGLPDGWSGKLWALEQGLRAGAGREAPFLLFTDADIAHPEDSLKKLVTAALGHDLDLVSLMATLKTDTFWARLLLPAFVYFFAMLYPFARVNRPSARTAAAAGGCVLLRREAFERAGGLSPIAGALIDDCALGRLVKEKGRAQGGRIWLGLGRNLLSLRNSESLADVWHMVRRTAFVQLRYSNLLLAGTLAGMTIIFLLPAAALPASALLLANGGGAVTSMGVLATGLAAWSLMYRTYLPMNKWYGQPRRFALALPLSALLYTLMTFDSAWCFWRKRGGSWKGRTYRIQ
jgi:hopene-associated glycosyltransferase HpnB